MIDAISYLDSAGVDYKTSGKNVSRNDVNIDCPWCGADKHLAIHRTKGTLNCWVCSFSDLKYWPTFINLIMELDGISYPKAVEVIKEFSDSDGENDNIDRSFKPKKTKIELPSESQSFDNPKSIRHRDLALKYLKSRNFGTDVIDKYKLVFCSTGEFAFRIIIPYYYAGKLITFSGRTYLNREPRYKHLSATSSVMTPKEFLYPIDMFSGDHLRLVEGPTDVWRIGGDSSLALSSNRLSYKQMELIKDLKLKSLSIFLDQGSYNKAIVMGEQLSGVIDRIKIISMEGGDVAECTREEILKAEAERNYFNF